MKNLSLVCLAIVCILVSSCNKRSLKYDFSKATSQSDIDSLFAQIKRDHKDLDLDNSYGLNTLTIKGMHYAGVPIDKALLTNSYTLLTTDSTDYAAKKLLETVESQKGLTKKLDSYGDRIEFEWQTETEDLKYELTLVNGKHLADLGDKDHADLTLTFKPVYEMPLANIHKKIKSFDSEPEYQLILRAYDCVYDVILNDIMVEGSSDHTDFNLNNFITGETSTLEIAVKPQGDDGLVTTKNFGPSANFSAAIVDVSTNKIIKSIDQIDPKGNTPIIFSVDFDSSLPYYPKAWTDGADLRTDHNLREKIIALYKKLGKAIVEKDGQTINDMMYQKDFEMQQVVYDTKFETAIKEWEAYLDIQENSYKYTVAKEFEIEYNANGRLIYTYPKDKNAMLILTGKGYDYKIAHFLYQPKGSTELKIIR